ncbi:MAG: DNA replication/repair protein RecF [Gammaproteobacteria bacterium]|nr:MAG: DNA replication/repair protein RecF [Gammaproteobacteria bacterium]
MFHRAAKQVATLSCQCAYSLSLARKQALPLALQTLLVQNLRIIEQLDISLAADANLFIGENGAGKTSILEAIDVLSRGRSFRERRTSPLVRKQATDLIVSGKVDAVDGFARLGIQKSSKQTVLHCNQEKVASISSHASYLPVLCMHPDSHQLIQGSGKHRRNYMDWSAFHVKHQFLQNWRDYNKCLRQRNTALRNRCDTEELSVWTNRLSVLGEEIGIARSEIFQEISPYFDNYSNSLLPECEVSMSYHRGWSEEAGLETALCSLREQELVSKTTGCGPHRANIKLFLNQQDAAAVASRGQQKLIAACLLLAQINHIQHFNKKKCVVLLDDIRAELDQQHAHALITALQTLGCQVFITAIEEGQIELLGWDDTKVFHVKQGVCKPMK